MGAGLLGGKNTVELDSGVCCTNHWIAHCQRINFMAHVMYISKDVIQK